MQKAITKLISVNLQLLLVCMIVCMVMSYHTQFSKLICNSLYIKDLW